MNLAARILELPPRLAWKRGQILSAALYRRAFRRWGRDSVMVSPLKIQGAERISVGDDRTFFHGAWLAAETDGELIMGDQVYLGHRAHLHAVGRIVSRSGVMVTDRAHLGNGGRDSLGRMGYTPGEPVLIGDGVFTGQGATVLGERAVVTRDVPAGVTVAGVPARVIKVAEGLDQRDGGSW